MANSWLKMQFIYENVTFGSKKHEIFGKFLKTQRKKSSKKLNVLANPLGLLAENRSKKAWV